LNGRGRILRNSSRLGERARCEYEAKYTAARNYAQLMEIYERAIAVARGRGMA